MATLSSTGSGSTLSRLQPNNNSNSVHQHSSNSSTLSTPAVAGLGSAESIESNPKAWSKGSGRLADEISSDAARHKIVAIRDTKSLDYISRTMLAGGIAGITVSTKKIEDAFQQGSDTEAAQVGIISRFRQHRSGMRQHLCSLRRPSRYTLFPTG